MLQRTHAKAEIRCVPRPFARLTIAAVPAVVVVWLTGCASSGPAPVVSLDSSGAPSGTSGSVAPKPKRYRVSKGETLYSIAWAYGLDYRALASWNQVPPPYRIYPDQQLRLTPPVRAESVEAAQQPTAITAKLNSAVAQPAPVKTPSPRREPPPPPKQASPPRSEPQPPPKKTSAPRSEPQPVSKPVVKPTKPATAQPSDGSLRWIWPTRGAVVQTFRKGDRTRQGIRIAGKVGQSILSAESGRVVYTGSGLPGYGKLIIIKHNKNYLSAYGFNRKLLVKDGEKVAKGERVAEMGKSADGKALLHFEIRRRDNPLNPLKLLPR